MKKNITKKMITSNVTKSTKELKKKYGEKFYELDSETYCLETDDIYLKYYKKRNFGKFLIKITKRDGYNCISVTKPDGRDEISYYSSFHPHLSGTHICLGNLENYVYKCLRSGLLTEAFNGIVSVLESYGRNNPYRRLGEFDYCSRCGDLASECSCS